MMVWERSKFDLCLAHVCRVRDRMIERLHSSHLPTTGTGRPLSTAKLVHLGRLVDTDYYNHCDRFRPVKSVGCAPESQQCYMLFVF